MEKQFWKLANDHCRVSSWTIDKLLKDRCVEIDEETENALHKAYGFLAAIADELDKNTKHKSGPYCEQCGQRCRRGQDKCGQCLGFRRGRKNQRRKKKLGYSSLLNDLAKTAGFGSYAGYLASDTWKEIRDRVFEEHPLCQMCGDEPKVVHHQEYSLALLRGANLTGLVALCERCHTKVHFVKGKKRPFKEAIGYCRNRIEEFARNGDLQLID